MTETTKSLELEEYILSKCYAKAETYTQAEVRAQITTAISNLTLIVPVSSLPTSNIKTNVLYIVPNNENPEIAENLYDIYIRYNNKWERLDSLEFNITDYAKIGHVHVIADITGLQTALNGKAASNHVHSNATTSANGFMSSTDKTKLDGIATGANKTTVDSSLSSSSTNPVQNKVVYNALNNKSDSSHDHDTRYYTQEEVDTKLDAFIGEEGELQLQNYYTKTETEEKLDNKISSISIDSDLILTISYGE